MSTSNDDHQHSHRADVVPLQKALCSPSPLGNILDNLHRDSEDGIGSSRYKNLSPSPSNIDFNDPTTFTIGKSDCSVSIANSVAVSTIVDGVHHTISHWKIILFGQLLSFLLAAAGAASEELNQTCHVNVPLTQTTLVGGFLMLLGAFKMRGWCAGCCLGRSTKKTDGDPVEDSHVEESQNAIQSPLTGRESNPSFTADDINTDGCISYDESRRPTSQPRPFCWGVQTIHTPWWVCLIASLAAVEGRYLLFLAFKYTSFSFIFLAQALALPSAMFFSKCILARHYRVSHVLGGLVCLCGIILSVVPDVTDSEVENSGLSSDNMNKHLKGDILAVSGAVLLGLDDVLSEMLVEHGGVGETLFVKWFFGLGISMAQLVIFERDSFEALFDDQGEASCTVSTRLYLLGGYAVFQILEMAGEVRFLGVSEAALLNISLLTSDLWAAAFSVVAEGLIPSGLYYVSLLFIIAGIVLYQAGPSPLDHATPSDIKIRMHLESDGNKDRQTLGQLEMT